MATAKWNGEVVAESEVFETVEGNIYFPRNSIHMEFFKDSTHSSVCPWKGTASYFSLSVHGKTNENAAWFYENPKKEAEKIKGYVAFWKGVEVNE